MVGFDSVTQSKAGLDAFILELAGFQSGTRPRAGLDHSRTGFGLSVRLGCPPSSGPPLSPPYPPALLPPRLPVCRIALLPGIVLSICRIGSLSGLAWPVSRCFATDTRTQSLSPITK